jgi:GntR family transcriptional regulator, transcriptional repressor for pyruvate dehydrogenase complex
MSLEERQDVKNLKRAQRHKPVYLQVVEQIQQMIKEGELTPGDQLLPERVLAEKIGVSRTSVRQSLAILDGMGIIEITPRDGAYVKRQPVEGAMAPLLQVLYRERNQVDHLFEVRHIIETQAVRLAALRRDAADLQRLQALNERFKAELHDGDLAFEANTRFHLCIVETAKNTILAQILSTVLLATIEVYMWARQQSFSNVRNLLRFVDEHQQIIEAIAQKDPDLAASLLTKHIEDARRRVETVIEREQ